MMNDQQEKFNQELAIATENLNKKLKHRLLIEIAVIVSIGLVAAFFVFKYSCGNIVCLCSF